MRHAVGARPRWLLLALSVLLLSCVGVFAVQSWRWPEVNDPAQISYLCWLMDHGVRPYKDMIEMNMPGIYMTNWSVMHLLGAGSLAWRIFDLLLAAVAGVAMLIIALPYDWFAGLLAAALFTLFHAHDGPAQLGQRDYIIAVLMMAAYAFLFEAERRGKPWLLFPFGVCAAATATYKPQALIFGLFLLCVLCWRHIRQGRPWVRPLMLSVAGMLVPLLLVFWFLAREQAVAAFFHTAATMLPYYATLDRLPLLQLLRRAFPPSVTTLLLLSAVAAYAQRRTWNWERAMLLAGIAFGAFSELVQGKGPVYHRYPIAACIFIAVSIELVLALRRQGWVRAIAYAGVLYAAATALLYTQRSLHRVWDEAYNEGLTADLQTLGGRDLSGSAQCITLAADCATVFYRLGIAQSTGLVYDYFIFGDPHYAAITDSRARFWAQLQAHPPRVIVLGRWLYPENENDYSKLNHWPQFRDYLNAHYAIEMERYYPPAQVGIRGYRIYVRRQRE